MPVLIEMMEKFNIECLWEENIGYNFNLLLAKKIFRSKELSLITASGNGIVRIHKSTSTNGILNGFEKFGRNYETKGGPIQTLISQNVTKFNSEDILVGDSNGLFTIITNGQILNRRCLCDSKITSVVVDVDSAGNTSIVTGSSDGTLVAVTPYDILWKCRLSEALKQEQQANISSVTSLHVFHTQSSSTDASYLLVADSQRRIHFFQNGRLVLSLTVPSVVTDMCSGYFINESANEVPNISTPPKSQRYYSDDQVAMATESGAIFVLSNFNIMPYSNLSFPLTQIKAMAASGADDTDALLCSGHFNKLCILQNRKCVSVFPTHDWIHTLDVVDQEFSSDSVLLLLGSLDSTVKLVKLSRNRELCK